MIYFEFQWSEQVAVGDQKLPVGDQKPLKTTSSDFEKNSHKQKRIMTAAESLCEFSRKSEFS